MTGDRYPVFGGEREKREKRDGTTKNKVIAISATCTILK
jgi:hypothetical protein